jgi:hypothetical protein
MVMSMDHNHSHLRIKTFSEQGVSCFFKALGHIEAQKKLRELLEKIKDQNFDIYDPEDKLEEFLDITRTNIKCFGEIYIQKLENINKLYNSRSAKLISDIVNSKNNSLLILAFDAHKYRDQIKHLIPTNVKILTLDEIRIPDHMILIKDHYLNRLNWTTNFVWFKEKDGVHTRMVSANCWVKYGSKNIMAYFYLLDHSGKILSQWEEKINNKLAIFTLDSHDVKKRFKLQDFMGQIFVHIVGTLGHDIMKYALDTYGDDPKVLSATHDANPWPAMYYAGLPAPKKHEKVILWLQNTHPLTIEIGDVSLNIMGDENNKKYLTEKIPAYGSLEIDISELFPDTFFPIQFEIDAGNYFVRPRYEVFDNQTKRSCIAHVNVQRDNLAPDTNFKKIHQFLGKGYILSAPILPIDTFATEVLPTPMSRLITHMPLKVIIYSDGGQELAVHRFGNMPRNKITALSINELVKGIDFFKKKGNYGNMQIVYDMESGSEVDGWIHSILKYQNRNTGHLAETSFGSHIFNNITTYKNEPQSYKGPPPGLSTNLFLRVGTDGHNTMSYLMYPVSKEWHTHSNTAITLFDDGDIISSQNIKIPANGCILVDCYKIFGEQIISNLRKPHIIIADSTCRLFGYHLLVTKDSFSLDHMFGF